MGEAATVRTGGPPCNQSLVQRDEEIEVPKGVFFRFVHVLLDEVHGLIGEGVVVANGSQVDGQLQAKDILLSLLLSQQFIGS